MNPTLETAPSPMPTGESLLKGPQLGGDSKGGIRGIRPRIPTRVHKVQEARELKPEVFKPEDW
ncbi:hypothetical protein GUJ93_ZPchr0009g86 [Zizania palustris]|uniref:Uncharacterized protein n=1 Tax=Zizania palustris TaxID=103762 RepID=A0A8J5S6B3_ZIZPA|nr:hypothetical protein GUJ93_ZPchr0009g86 [Zizania palustris]